MKQKSLIISGFQCLLAADEGFEPSKWWIQSPLPYRLANPQGTLLLYNIFVSFSKEKIQFKFTF